jgi:hypothetical protein
MSDVQSATIRGNVRVIRGDVVRWQHTDPLRPMAGTGEIVDIKRGSSWTGTRLIVRTSTGTTLVFANEAERADGR